MKTKTLFQKAICLMILFQLNNFCYSQNVGINSTGVTPSAAAMLDVDAAPGNNKGLLIPRISLTQTSSNAPIGGVVVTSLLVYNTATINDVTPGYYYWDGTKWVSFTGSNSNDWALLGNAGTTAGTNFLGTTDAKDLVFKTNATEWMRVTSGGRFGFGTNAPSVFFDVVNPSAAVYPAGDAKIRVKSNSTSSTARFWAENDLGNFNMYGLGCSAFAINVHYANAGILYNSSGVLSQYYHVNKPTGFHAFEIGIGDDQPDNRTEVMRIISTGVGIGTTAPATLLEVAETSVSSIRGIVSTQYGNNTIGGRVIARKARGTLAAPTASLGGDNEGLIIFEGYDGAAFGDGASVETKATENWGAAAHGSNLLFSTVTNGTTARNIRMTIDDAGRVGIVNGAPTFTLDVTGTGRFTSDLYANTKVVLNADPVNYYVGAGIPNGFIVQTWDEVRYQFNGGGSNISMKNGSLGIGIAVPTQALHVVGNICYTGGIGACSDVRYKKDFTPLANSLEKVLKINGLNYFWKQEEFPEQKFSSDKQIGFIAQDLEKIYPELVTTDKNGFKSVDYSRLTPILVEAIKEQQKKIDSLELKIQSSALQNENLKTEVSNLKTEYGNRLNVLEGILSARAQK